jgi:glycosyltransferase involved in cell wall biosynthesis
MKLDILMSCMNQIDDRLIRDSRILGDAVVINQCGREDNRTYQTEHGTVRWFDSAAKGLTVSRNMALEKSDAQICLLCDDDEVFERDYAEKIRGAYEALPDADVIIFKMVGRTPSFEDRIMRLKFPMTMRVSSWQISFRRESLMRTGIRFDELLGAGTGNGAEEELKFLTDCEKSGLKIYYVPEEIAAVAQTESTWFKGFDETFFYNRGATTRYILGWPMAAAYGLYYVVKKQQMYSGDISPRKALRAIFRGVRENKIGKQAGRQTRRPEKE